MDTQETSSLARLDSALQSARAALDALAGDHRPAARCAPGEHALPDSARPGQPTKCRKCRSSVRAPKLAPDVIPVMPVADHEAKIADLKSRFSIWRAEQASLREALESENARLEAEVARLEEQLASDGKRCRKHSQDLLCPYCANGGEDYY